jgi:predicted acetyltransferase
VSADYSRAIDAAAKAGMFRAISEELHALNRSVSWHADKADALELSALAKFREQIDKIEALLKAAAPKLRAVK